MEVQGAATRGGGASHPGRSLGGRRGHKHSGALTLSTQHAGGVKGQEIGGSQRAMMPRRRS